LVFIITGGDQAARGYHVRSQSSAL